MHIFLSLLKVMNRNFENKKDYVFELMRKIMFVLVRIKPLVIWGFEMWTA